MFTNFDVKDILFGQWWQYSRILWIYSRESKFISFRSKLRQNILPILTSHCKNKQTSNLHFHNTQNGMVFCLMELKLSPQLFQLM